MTTSEIQNTPQNNERNYGIDLLRITAMLMIIIFHIIYPGGVDNRLTPMSSNYYLVVFMRVLIWSGVNIYALISGYVGLNSEFRPYKIISLWIEVFFYLVLSAAIGFFLSPEAVTLKMLIMSFFPLRNGDLWYFTAYFAMFFFIPFFNRMINTLDRKTVKNLITIMILLFCLLPTLLNDSNLFYLNSGYIVLWLSVLYITGGYIKKYQPEANDKKPDIKYLLGFFICTIIGFIYYFAAEHITIKLSGEIAYSKLLLKYNSPIVFLQAVFALLFFSRIKIKNKIAAKIIKIFSASTFGVYAIHINVITKNFVMPGIYTPPRTISSIKLFFSIIILALAIFLICSLIDFIRIQLFRLIRMDSLSKKISGIFENIFYRISDITDKYGI